ncbi:hypothetical protein CY34DRAFT_813369 [Suillus luteus UH-Slu-Lm8-n1]|uniref:Uncharacterized protein n=1 Tax=Suillus luteus UH-Slu-Lm8-n1 TaxID=930992 RepID=A0A0D0AP55_9AGAM|nr:hypothetical protein CY34DRAFT_813369 [Suillus luteus UH-Slu-Lm8-n1]
MTSSTNPHSFDHFEDYSTVSVRKYYSMERLFQRNNFFGGLLARYRLKLTLLLRLSQAA